jgi:hypothetical protein
LPPSLGPLEKFTRLFSPPHRITLAGDGWQIALAGSLKYLIQR